MAYFLKLGCSSWRMGRLVLLKMLVVHISGSSLLNDGVEYSRLGGATIICLLEPSLWVVPMYA